MSAFMTTVEIVARRFMPVTGVFALPSQSRSSKTKSLDGLPFVFVPAEGVP